MAKFDRGPSQTVAKLFDQCPSYEPFRKSFWYEWGPIFYRGRLDGSARLLCVASDPGPTERIAARTLVGDAGQRVQGFLSKLGLTHSYVCLNALVYALFPTHGFTGKTVIKKPEHTQWRNKVFDSVDAKLEAIVAFGTNAQLAVSLWPGASALPVVEVPHPSSHDAKVLLDAWRPAITKLRGIVTPDSDGDATLPNYGTKFLESDYARIPSRDLPFGMPPWFGDDSWGRTGKPKHNNSADRPSTDKFHTIVWQSPKS